MARSDGDGQGIHVCTPYKLLHQFYQTADLLFTLELVRLRLENNMFSKSDKIFFGSPVYLPFFHMHRINAVPPDGGTPLDFDQ